MNAPQKFANTLPREHRNTPWREEADATIASLDTVIEWLQVVAVICGLLGGLFLLGGTQ